MSTVTMTAQAAPEFRAAGTDLSERRRSGVSKGPLIDIAAGGDTSITWAADGAATIGAFATIATIAADARIRDAYPGVSAAAQDCFKKGGTDCPARSGNHLYGVAFDLGPCVAPHPSTMAAALLAYEAKIVTDRRSGLSVRDLLGDASNGRSDHALGPGEMIKQIVLGVPLAGERALYKRAISRTYAEWPLVELCARAVVADGVFKFVRLGAGGIAPVPLRLQASEAALQGKPADAAAIEEAARQATVGAKPLPMTGYKLDLLSGLVRDLLEQLAGNNFGR
jgi:xanthine dehydrogenase YagS FAD-binding subunit